MDTPSTTVGPGLGAFIAFFVLAVALWLLMRNMNGRMRRMAYKEQQRVAELEAREGDGANQAAQGNQGSPGHAASPLTEAEREAAKRPAQPPTDPAQPAEDKADPAP
jgi:hypothetical protein